MVKIHWPKPGWPPEKHECMCDERDYQIIDKEKQYFLEKGFPCQNSATHCLISASTYTFLCERHAGRVPEDAGELVELPESTFRVESDREVSEPKTEDSGARSLCLTCMHLPKLEPCKVLTGPTMQYSGRCNLRPPHPNGEYRYENYTPLWVDFERKEAWEDGHRSITECAFYKPWESGNHFIKDVREPSSVGKYVRVSLKDDRVFEGTVVLDQEDLLDLVHTDRGVQHQVCIQKDLISSTKFSEDRKFSDES